MVDGESAVLPAPAALDLDDLAASLHDEPELDETEPSASRSSHPFTDKDGATRPGFVPRTNNVRPNVVIAPPGGGTISSLSGSDNSSCEAADSTVAEMIASLESGSVIGLPQPTPSPMLAAAGTGAGNTLDDMEATSC